MEEEGRRGDLAAERPLDENEDCCFLVGGQVRKKKRKK